jgi:hypothetical protein
LLAIIDKLEKLRSPLQKYPQKCGVIFEKSILIPQKNPAKVWIFRSFFPSQGIDAASFHIASVAKLNRFFARPACAKEYTF